MKIDLPPDLEARVARLAADQGRAPEALIREAIERWVNFEEWLMAEVEKGLASAARGEFIDHEEIGKLLDRRYGS